MIEPVPPITWLGTDSLFVPPPGTTGLYIFPHSAPPPRTGRRGSLPARLPGCRSPRTINPRFRHSASPAMRRSRSIRRHFRRRTSI
ncbi:MAG: hypothetical protein U0703_19230 [Anaerolineae bacterium]